MMPQQEDLLAILQVMEDYGEGLMQADVSILEKAFHPDARYVNANPDDPMHYDMETYFKAVSKRVPPVSRGEVRQDRISQIILRGSDMAFVDATMRMMGRDYLDHLTLIRRDGRWAIISKVFQYQAQEEES